MMAVDEEDEADKRCYEHGLASLQFFCYPGATQVESWHKAAQQALPRFFPDIDEADRSCDYFVGVACVFTTYWGYVRDASILYGSGKWEALKDLSARLGYYMFEANAEDWLESAVLDKGNAMWEDLRRHARLALEEIGETPPSDPPTFIIDELVNPYEFGGIGPTDSWDSVSSPEI